MDTIRPFLTWKLGVAVVGVALGIVIAVLFVRKAKPKDDEDEEPGVIEIFFFYTAWCPYCKNTRPEWDAFKRQWNNQEVNGYTVVMSEVDCDMNEALANKYSVVGYPTIKLVKDGKVYDFDAKPDAETLTQFLKSCD